MQFVFPLFLTALAAIAIPIIIHLFHFRRFKTVYFTNVRFLKEVKEETSARSKLRNLLVLLSRAAAIAAMGFVGSDGTVPLLLEIAEKPDLRTTAVQSVKRVSSEQMLAALVVQGGDAATRKELLIELAHRKTPQAAFIWMHLVRTPDCRDLCLQVVDELSPELIDLLFAELDAPVIDDRLAAIQLLGSRCDESTFRRTELLCQNFPHRWEPVAILMWNGSETAMGFLARLQKNPERYAVIQTAAIQMKAATGAGSGSR